MSWQDYPAPHDRPIWLFLPCAKFDVVDGRPINIKHEVALARWEDPLGFKPAADPPGHHSRILFGSKWHDYQEGDPQPEEPDLGQQA